MRTHNTLKCVLPMQTNSSLLLSVPGLMGWILDILDYVHARKKVTVGILVWTISQDHLLNIILRIIPSFDMRHLILSQRMLRYDTRVSTGQSLFSEGAWTRLSYSEEENHKVCQGTWLWDRDLSHFLYYRDQLSICRAGKQSACWGWSGQCRWRWYLSELPWRAPDLEQLHSSLTKTNIYLNWTCLEE